jgi:hypothetical protein
MTSDYDTSIKLTESDTLTEPHVHPLDYADHPYGHMSKKPQNNALKLCFTWRQLPNAWYSTIPAVVRPPFRIEPLTIRYKLSRTSGTASQSKSVHHRPSQFHWFSLSDSVPSRWLTLNCHRSFKMQLQIPVQQYHHANRSSSRPFMQPQSSPKPNP